MALAAWGGNGALGSPTSDHSSRRDAEDRGLAAPIAARRHQLEVAANAAVAGLNLLSPAPVDRASPRFAARGSPRPHSPERVPVGPWGAVDADAPPAEPAPMFIAPPTVAVAPTDKPPPRPRTPAGYGGASNSSSKGPRQVFLRL